MTANIVRRLAALKGKGLARSLTPSMLLRGTIKRRRQQIADELNRLKAQVNVFGGASGARVKGWLQQQMVSRSNDNEPAALLHQPYFRGSGHSVPRGP